MIYFFLWIYWFSLPVSVARSGFCLYRLLTQPYDSQKNINCIELGTLDLILSCGHDILYVWHMFRLETTSYVWVHLWRGMMLQSYYSVQLMLVAANAVAWRKGMRYMEYLRENLWHVFLYPCKRYTAGFCLRLKIHIIKQLTANVLRV